MENDKGESPVANGEYSIAIGTDDLEALGKLKDMAGSTIAAEMPEANGNLSEAKGISTKAESTSAVADGVSSTAGIKGYYWNTITINNDGTSTITLSNEQYSSSAVKSTDWAEGDYISIVNNTKYAFVGQITSITSGDSGTTIVVNSTKMGENKYSTLELLLKQLKPDDRTIFAIHRTKNSSTSVWTNTPRTGTVELAWGARACGLNNLSAGTFGNVFGGNNALVGDFGFVTGRDNLGGYGNVVGGGWNESTGVHSAIIGRELKNYDDYTLMSGYGNQVLKGNLNAVTGGQNIVTNGSGNLIGGYDNDVVSGNQSVIGGKENVITKGNGNILGGYQNTLEDSTYSVVGGNGHTVSGDQDAVFGSSNTISDRSHYNVVGGLENQITSGAKHNLETGNGNEITGAKSHNNAVSGSKNSISSSENIVGGNNNDVNTTGNIVGGATNKINNGTQNIVGGKENTLFNSTYSVVGGNSHDIYGDQNAVFGSDNTIGTSSSRVHYNIVGGKGNIVSASATLTSGEQNKTKHKDSSTIGYGLETSAASQTVLGQYNDISDTSQDVLVVGYGSSDSPKNVLTVPRSGEAKKDTDAVTLKTLKNFNEQFKDKVDMSTLVNIFGGELHGLRDLPPATGIDDCYAFVRDSKDGFMNKHYSAPVKPNSLVARDEDGDFFVKEPTHDYHPVNLGYLNNKLEKLDFVKIVDKLPATGLVNYEYFVRKNSPDTNDLFDEYAWVNIGTDDEPKWDWEIKGTKQFEIDLSDYVKKTDYASDVNVGLVRVGEGLTIGSSSHKLNIAGAQESHILAKNSNYRPITPSILDYAVKVGMTTNNTVLTDEEKAAAQAWLGITDLIGKITKVTLYWQDGNLIGTYSTIAARPKIAITDIGNKGTEYKVSFGRDFEKDSDGNCFAEHEIVINGGPFDGLSESPDFNDNLIHVAEVKTLTAGESYTFYLFYD